MSITKNTRERLSTECTIKKNALKEITELNGRYSKSTGIQDLICYFPSLDPISHAYHTTFKNLFISNLEQKLIDGAGSKLVT